MNITLSSGKVIEMVEKNFNGKTVSVLYKNRKVLCPMYSNKDNYYFRFQGEDIYFDQLFNKDRLKEITETILPELYEDFSNAKSNLTKKFLMDTMFELENEKTTLILKGDEQDELE